MGLGWPIGLDRWLDDGETPTLAEAIVYLGGGTSTENLALIVGIAILLRFLPSWT